MKVLSYTSLLSATLVVAGCVATSDSFQQRVVDDLGVTSEFAVVVRTPKYCSIGGVFTTAHACASKHAQGYLIEISPIYGVGRTRLLEAHELAHVKQFESGMCFSYGSDYNARIQEVLAINYANCVISGGGDCGVKHNAAMQDYLGC